MEQLEQKSYTQEDIDNKLPLPFLVYHILFSLIGSERHGYEIMQRVELESGKNVSPTSLYRTLKTMTNDGLIEKTGRVDEDNPRRGFYYKMTKLGQHVGAAERKRQLQMSTKADESFGSIVNPS